MEVSRVLYRTRSLCARCALVPPSSGVEPEEWKPARVETQLIKQTQQHRKGDAQQERKNSDPFAAVVAAAKRGASPTTNVKRQQQPQLSYNHSSIAKYGCGDADDDADDDDHGEVSISVFLVCECSVHGEQRVRLSSNAAWFEKMSQFRFFGHGSEFASFSSAAADGVDLNAKWGMGACGPSLVPDVEDLQRKLALSPSSDNLPMAVEIALHSDGKFMSNDDIVHRIHYYRSLYPPERRFVLRLTGRTAMDIDALNEKVLFACMHVPAQTPVVVETTYERLCLLCRIIEGRGCFVRPNVYPGLKYYLREGDEDQCISELTKLFSELKAYEGISMAVTLCVSPPFPKLDRLLAFIRREYGFIRLVTISLERSPLHLLESLRARGGESPPPPRSSTLQTHEEHDVYQLLCHIASETQEGISVDDLVPASLAGALEPFLKLLGLGWFFIRPGPMCGFGTVLVNTKERFQSEPVTRMIDAQKLFALMKPLLPRLADGKVGIVNAKRLHSVFKSSIFPQRKPDVPKDLASYLTDSKKASTTREFIRNLQFFVVHNNMDIAALDLVRRCECAVGTVTGAGVAAYCTGCL